MKFLSKVILALCIAWMMAGCASQTVLPVVPDETPPVAAPAVQHEGNEVVMYAMALIERGYRFGGNNPDSGLDCSGMVSYIYQHALGIELPHNAAQMAAIAREIPREKMVPGDLVFFNTTGKPFSHVGIYIGDDRFIHAPKRNGKISISSLKNQYFANRLQGVRTFFR